MSKTNKIFAYLTGATLTTAAGISGAADPAIEAANPVLDSTINVYETDADEHAEKPETATETAHDLEMPEGVSNEVLNQQRATLVHAIVRAFDSADAVTRSRLVTEWTLSDSVVRRRAMAKVLSHSFDCLGSEGAAAFLTTDPEPVVRREMVDTVMARMPENPKYYRSLLQRLAADSNRKTRRAARQAIQELREIQNG